MFYITRQLAGSPKPPRIIATFSKHAEKEAYLALNTLRIVSQCRTKDNEYYQKRTYALTSTPPPPPRPQHASEHTDIQVDLSQAKPTKRPIVFEFSHRPSNMEGQCTCLAFHRTYGTVRGTVPNEPAGRKLFLARVRAVWPNADLVKH